MVGARDGATPTPPTPTNRRKSSGSAHALGCAGSVLMLKILLIGSGGAGGSILRYLIGDWVQRATGSSFPLGTLIVNVTGCLAIGFLGSLFGGPVPVREEYRLAVLVGILGGYTTFSSYGRETMTLAGDRQWWFATANLLASNALGLAAVWVGARLSARWFGPQ
jgi:CrcB protein